MMEILNNGFIKLEKEPYNGIVVINGSVDNAELQKKIDAMISLEPLMMAKVGIGPSRIQDLIQLGYTNIEQLKE